MPTKLEQSVEALSKTIHDIVNDPDVIKAFLDKLDEVLNSAKSCIDWKMKDKYEVGTYRGFLIVHHFRNMPNPYRVTLRGPVDFPDPKLFEAESEEEIVQKIDSFYDLDWRVCWSASNLKQEMLNYGNFLFIKSESLSGRVWETSLQVYREQQYVFSQKSSVSPEELMAFLHFEEV